MGFYQPFTIIKDAQRHGLKVLPVDVTRSDWECTLEDGLRIADCGLRIGGGGLENCGFGLDSRGRRSAESAFENSIHESGASYSPNRSPAMRLGLRYVKGLREEPARAVESERAKRPFTDVDDLHNRVPELHKNELRKLAEVGALNFIGRKSEVSGQRSEIRGQKSEVRSLAVRGHVRSEVQRSRGPEVQRSATQKRPSIRNPQSAIPLASPSFRALASRESRTACRALCFATKQKPMPLTQIQNPKSKIQNRLPSIRNPQFAIRNPPPLLSNR